MTFKYTIETDPNKIDYKQVAKILEKVGLISEPNENKQEQAFKNSDVTVFIKDEQRIIGLGRALSDGVSQAAIYNIAVDPDYQKQHVGHTIILYLLEQLKGLNIILYTHPQTLTLYEKYGFRRNKTAFAHFQAGTAEDLQWMEEEGFFLPEGFRFNDEKGRY